MKLTQKVVDGITGGDNRVAWDDELLGLGLRVQSGRRSWIVRYRVAGLSRQKSLPGSLPLKQARIRAAQIRTGAAGGLDVVAAGRAEADKARKQAEVSRLRSLGVLTEQYLIDAERRLRPGSLRIAKLYLRGHWKSLHHRPADELTRREIVAVLEGYAGRVTAAQMLRHLSACLTWGVDRELLERHSALGISPPVQSTDRDRTLSAAEIRSVWSATDPAIFAGANATHVQFAAIVRLLLLLGQRRGEVGGMAWSELNLDRAVWTLPAARAKNGRAHEVFLPQQAMEILRVQKREARPFLFGVRGVGFSQWDTCKTDLDKASGVTGWTLHDLRRTSVTGMAEIGVLPHIVEAIVNHISGHKAGVAGTYNRALYAAEKRVALQRWADYVERIVTGEPAANVVAFGR